MKAAYIALCGLPNAGKSTLVNRLLSEYIAAVSAKPQTTRRCMTYIYYDGERQLVLLDTPGYFMTARDKLDAFMLETISKAAKDADFSVFLCTGDPLKEDVIDFIRSISGKPVICIMNKTDLLSEEELCERKNYLEGLTLFSDVIPFSALKAEDHSALFRVLDSYLYDVSEPLYDPDYISLEMERDLIEEFIRVELYLKLTHELPYATGVRVEEMKERGNGKVYIKALVYCERDGQKKIIIGSKGSKLSEIGSSARKRIEAFLGKKVFLDLWVKVYNGWRKKERFLKNMGYRSR